MGNLPTVEGLFPGHVPGGNLVTVGLRNPAGPPPDWYWNEMNHAERQRRRWSAGLRIEDA